MRRKILQRKKTVIMISAIAFFVAVSCRNDKVSTQSPTEVPRIWNLEQALKWKDQNGWLRGSNFNPSTAINQLETWQAETFDTATISS